MSGARAWMATGAAGIDGLRLEERPAPVPGVGEALVRMRAATLNYRDLIGLRGDLPGMTKAPDYVPLSCACAEVVAIGDGVARVKLGDRVLPLFDQGWLSGGPENMSRDQLGGSVDGVARDLAVFLADYLVPVPDALGDMEAASLPCAAITAWSALFAVRDTRAGDIVVVQGTGGVSIAAVQLAHAVGATVIVTSSSDAKLARAKLLGADHGINYRTTPDWATAVRNATGGRGAGIVLDVVGASQLDQSAAALAEDGMIAAIGMLEGGFSWGRQAARPIVPVTVGNRGQVENMLADIVAYRVRPVVDRIYPLERLPDALRTMESGTFFGKIGVSFD